MASVARLIALVLACALGSTAEGGDAGGSGTFDLVLESADFPDLDERPVIVGDPGDEFLFTADMILATSGLIDGGPQGWSCAIWHAGVDVVELSIEGTASATTSDGGFRADDGDASFFVYEIVDPELNEGRTGVFQAAVLSFHSGLTLPPNTAQVMGRNTYRATVRSPGTIAFLRFEDDRIGNGIPVANIITVTGRPMFPELGEREITIGIGATPEICNDGVDNDRDGWIDCDDPNCYDLCGPENCADEFDNDLDGLTDCEDPDCERAAVCQEACDDGIDNDLDGAVDCDDIECRGHSPCPDLERCGDGVDNDEDGLIDCDDPECDRHPLCRDPEVCDDGVDNDLDGRVDCADSDCFGIDPCPPPEICDDGIDNDLDGRTDCDDEHCAGRVECREPEDCGDGVDNDLDGRTDCSDQDCSGVAPCPELEICDNRVDDDGDDLVDCWDADCGASPDCELAEGGSTGGFVFELTSAGARRSGWRNALDAFPGATIGVVAFIVPFREPQADGVQGWSLSIAHDTALVELVDGPTIDGTDAGALLTDGFAKTEIADDGQGREQGFVSSVVLSSTQPVTLDPARAQSIVRVTYLVTDHPGADADAGERDEGIRFRDGLEGSGQPVRNELTIDGRTARPRRQTELDIRRISPGNSFLRGDANDDGKVDLADAVWFLNDLVRGGPETPCRRACDVNGDGKLDVSDAVYLAAYRFQHGPAIPAPFPGCGLDPSRSDLPCPVGAATSCP